MKEYIAGLSSPSEARRMGRRLEYRKDWEDIKLDIMKEIIKCKFDQNADLQEKLLNTGLEELVEGNDWKCEFWGVDSRTGKGENHLGKILMDVREETRTRKKLDERREDR